MGSYCTFLGGAGAGVTTISTQYYSYLQYLGLWVSGDSLRAELERRPCPPGGHLRHSGLADIAYRCNLRAAVTRLTLVETGLVLGEHGPWHHNGLEAWKDGRYRGFNGRLLVAVVHLDLWRCMGTRGM